MKIEEFQTTLDDMSDEEIIDMVSDIRKNRSKNTISETKVKESRKRTKNTSISSALSSLSPEELELLRQTLKGK